MMRKKRTRTGARLARTAAAALLLSSFLLAAGQKKAAQPAALITGTVFRESGRALPGAQVTVQPADTAQSKRKFKKTEAFTNTRGEFAVRVPAGPAQYTVTVKAPGYQPQQKPASIQGEDAVDIFFLLEPAGKTSKK